jgi:hypothetical protein
MSGIAILKLQRAGFTDEQVEALAEYHEAGAATKSDIADLQLKIEGLRSDLEIKASELDRKIEIRFSELDRKIDMVRADLQVQIANTKTEMIRWVVGIGFAQVATILAVLRLFPSVHP